MNASLKLGNVSVLQFQIRSCFYKLLKVNLSALLRKWGIKKVIGWGFSPQLMQVITIIEYFDKVGIYLS
jgi:hypothetical protein